LLICKYLYINKKDGRGILNELLAGVMEQVIKRNPNEPEFHQAVREVLESLEIVAEKIRVLKSRYI